MAVAYPVEVRERARILITTTSRKLTDIGAEIGVGARTLTTWIREEGWTRPPEATPGRVKFRRERYPALQRIFENRAMVADIAVVVDLSIPQINKIAAQEGWAPRQESAANRARACQPTDPATSAALAEIEAALRDPNLGRRDFLRLLQRAMALAARDALAGVSGADRTAQTLARLATTAESLPETAAPSADEDPFPDANELIEEIARRFEAFAAQEDEMMLQLGAQQGLG